MENKGLLFIPDISGFTRFVNEMEINHSRLIIQELLELLINANKIGLEISEVEGDAILFYKFGDPPSLNAIYGQVADMFRSFHGHLTAYEYRRFCQCDACRSAIDLTLKVITHYGEFTGYKVDRFQKLIGKDVIVAHQLLKNDIEKHEYWLITEELSADEPPQFEGWMQWSRSVKQTENGAVNFLFTQLTALKKNVKPETNRELPLTQHKKIISLSEDFETDIILLFHATGDFSYRSRWRADVLSMEEVPHFLPRVGMRCRCIKKNGSSFIYASSYSFSPERIEFSETDEKDNSVTYYTLQKKKDNLTQLTIDVYIPKGFVSELLLRFGRKKKLASTLKQSLSDLKKLITEIKIPGRP